MKQFAISVLTNNLEMYEQMKATFVTGGFNDANCRFLVFDNSDSNRYEPFSVYNQILSEAIEPYLIFCHQDVLLNKGHGIEQLTQVIETMNRDYPSWAVLGNAGMTSDFKRILHISNLYEEYSFPSLPQRVVTLDENFLVVKRAANLRVSSEFSGFHFYGADLCLHAMRAGFSCHVVDFHLTHISPYGDMGAIFVSAKQKFQAFWGTEYELLFLPTVCTVLVFTRKKYIRKFISKRRIFWLFFQILSRSIIDRLREVESAKLDVKTL